MDGSGFTFRYGFGMLTALFISCTSLAVAETSELRSTSATRAEVLKIVQERTNKELKTESEITLRSWTNADDHVLIVAKPQVSMFRDRIVFALLKKDTNTKKKKAAWKVVEYQVTSLNQNPLKTWEKKHKILPKDMFMLAQIAIQVED